MPNRWTGRTRRSGVWPRVPGPPIRNDLWSGRWAFGCCAHVHNTSYRMCVAYTAGGGNSRDPWRPTITTISDPRAGSALTNCAAVRYLRDLLKCRRTLSHGLKKKNINIQNIYNSWKRIRRVISARVRRRNTVATGKRKRGWRSWRWKGQKTTLTWRLTSLQPGVFSAIITLHVHVHLCVLPRSRYSRRCVSSPTAVEWDRFKQSS